MSQVLESNDPATAFVSVEAEVSYIVDDGVPPVRYVDWPEMEHENVKARYETKRVTIRNGRVADEEITLPTHGFAFVEHETKMKDFLDEEEILRVYYPETAAIIKAQSGAKRVLVFDHTLRTADLSRLAERWVREPVHACHNDYTEHSAPQRVRDILGEEEAEEPLKHRYSIIQTWRSIAPQVESEPLALCDGRTIPEVGFIPNQRRYKHRIAETAHIAYSPEHRWFYFPLMQRNEAIVFKVFDTDPSAGVRFTAHTAFNDPNTAPDAKIRESIEMRALAFY